jgi:hypothetical protein
MYKRGDSVWLAVSGWTVHKAKVIASESNHTGVYCVLNAIDDNGDAYNILASTQRVFKDKSDAIIYVQDGIRRRINELNTQFSKLTDEYKDEPLFKEEI